MVRSRGGPNGSSLVISAFRPPSTSNVWDVDVAGTWATGSSSTTMTAAGITTLTNNALVFAFFGSASTRTYSGPNSGWSQVGSQFRNLAAGDELTLGFTWEEQVTAGSTGDATLTANSATAARTSLWAFKYS